MSAARKVRKRPRAGTGGLRYARRSMRQLGQILIDCGHTKQTLRRAFNDIYPTLKEPREPWDPTRLDYVADLPHIITHWRNDRAYVDSGGRPIPLPLYGEGPCLRALIERVLPGRDVAEVLESLIRSKGIRRREGLYVPRAEFLALSDRSANIHCLEALSGMMDTVRKNLSGKGSFRLFERAVTNPNVSDEIFPAIHHRIEQRATDFLSSTDTELHVYEATSTDGPRSRVGVCVFVWARPALRGAQKSLSRQGGPPPGER